MIWNYYKVVGGKRLEQWRLKGGVTVFLISDVCHVSCTSHPRLDHITNLQTMDDEIPNYAVLFCLHFIVSLQSKQGQLLQHGCSSKNETKYVNKRFLWDSSWKYFFRYLVQYSQNFCKGCISAALQPSQLTCPLVQVSSNASSPEIFMSSP